MGSASELEYHLLLAHNLGLMDVSDHHRLSGLTTEIKHMLTSFIQRLRANR